VKSCARSLEVYPFPAKLTRKTSGAIWVSEYPPEKLDGWYMVAQLESKAKSVKPIKMKVPCLILAPKYYVGRCERKDVTLPHSSSPEP